MDRFIADKKFGKAINVKNLKSNMDRFIVTPFTVCSVSSSI